MFEEIGFFMIRVYFAAFFMNQAFINEIKGDGY